MYGIVNAFTKKSKQKRLTNGIAESINNHIKTTIKYSYGFENFERFRKKTLLIFSKNKAKKRVVIQYHSTIPVCLKRTNFN